MSNHHLVLVGISFEKNATPHPGHDWHPGFQHSPNWFANVHLQTFKLWMEEEPNPHCNNHHCGNVLKNQWRSVFTSIWELLFLLASTEWDSHEANTWNNLLYQKSEDRNHDILLVTTSGNNNSNKNLRFATRKSWCNQQNLITQTIYVWYIHLYIYWLIFVENVGKYISIQSNTWMLQCIIHMSNSYCRYQPPKKSQRRHLTCYATSSGLAIEMASVPNIFQVFQGRSQLNQQQVARRDGLRNPTS